MCHISISVENYGAPINYTLIKDLCHSFENFLSYCLLYIFQCTKCFNHIWVKILGLIQYDVDYLLDCFILEGINLEINSIFCLKWRYSDPEGNIWTIGEYPYFDLFPSYIL